MGADLGQPKGAWNIWKLGSLHKKQSRTGNESNLCQSCMEICQRLLFKPFQLVLTFWLVSFLFCGWYLTFAPLQAAFYMKYFFLKQSVKIYTLSILYLLIYYPYHMYIDINLIEYINERRRRFFLILLWELALNIANNNNVSLRQRYLSSIISAMNYSQIFSYRDSILATKIRYTYWFTWGDYIFVCLMLDS